MHVAMCNMNTIEIIRDPHIEFPLDIIENFDLMIWF